MSGGPEEGPGVSGGPSESGATRGSLRDPAIVGRIVRPHALAGELVVEPMSESSMAFEAGSRLWVDGRWMTVLRSRANRGRFVVLLEGIADRDAAEEMRDVELFVESEALPQLDSDRYYVHDLVGCRVEDGEGALLGQVVGVVPGPQDWLEIEKEGVRGLVPMAREIIREVDLEGKRIVVDPPKGLFDATALRTKERSGQKGRSE